MRKNYINIKYTEETFICGHCGMAVTPPENGTENRNHCPHCLRSCHADISIGDRRSSCRGIMDPIGIWVKPNREWALIHRCRKCGFLRTNRIAGDDNEEMLFALAAFPMTSMPFPAGYILGEKINAAGSNK